MISSNAQHGFTHLLMQAIKGSLAPSTPDACAVSVIPDLSTAKTEKLVMLTVSSYLFRLLLMIHFTPDQAIRRHFAAIRGVEFEQMDEQALNDALAECGNICCGILHRNLDQFFPHVGMSTPNIVERDCTSHLHLLGDVHVQHFRAELDADTVFHVSLCACAYADLDFTVDVNETGNATGELELF